ncbi:uncharacterized protein G2W53_030726 [Senna tora]|uniref:Uncharacterized protein n=1 Tax=Senna tora TaxID=362788 RepID=A0A834WBV5_9FABA|nr:uncharacterized protein G2W53_030726 [Senna tora]
MALEIALESLSPMFSWQKTQWKGMTLSLHVRARCGGKWKKLDEMSRLPLSHARERRKETMLDESFSPVLTCANNQSTAFVGGSPMVVGGAIGSASLLGLDEDRDHGRGTTEAALLGLDEDRLHTSACCLCFYRVFAFAQCFYRLRFCPVLLSAGKGK